MTSHKTATSTTAPKAIVALVAAGLGVATFTPAAWAAGPGPANDGDRQMHRMAGEDGQRMHGRDWRGDRQGGRHEGRMGMRMGPQGGRGMMMLGLGCGPNAAERLEHAIVSLSYRIDATDDQAGLLDDLKTTALDAQKQYAAVCEAIMPDREAMRGNRGDASKPRANILEMMQSRLQLEQARVTALGDILPKFEALYDALSDEQKASLEPRGKHHMGRGPGARPDAAAPTPEAPAPAEPHNG